MLNSIYKNFYYTSAPCGAGKTTAKSNEINNSNQAYIVVGPNKNLCKEIHYKIPSSTLIYSEAFNPETATERLTKAIKDKNRIIITTHQSLILVLGRPDLDFSSYNLVVDEDLNCLTDMTIRLSCGSFEAFRSQISFIHQDNGMIKLQAIHDESLRTMVTDFLWSSKDAIELCEKLLNPAYEVIISTEEYNRLIGTDFMDRSNDFDLAILCILKVKLFESFKSCHFMTALFEASEVKHVLEHAGIQCQKKSLDLLYEKHTNGQRLNVKYFSTHNASKALLN